MYKTIKINKIIQFMLFFVALYFLISYSNVNFTSVKTTLELFLTKVFPSLFPFILFTEIILKTNILNTISNVIIKKLFKKTKIKINQNIIPIILIGFLCGFPMGAKILSKSYLENKISKKELYILSSFINNCNPIFVISTVGIGIYQNKKIGIYLLLIHYLTSITFGLIYLITYNKFNNIIYDNKQNLNSFSKKSINTNTKQNTKFEMLTSSINNSFKTLSLVFGFMIIFNLLGAIISSFFLKFNLNENFSLILKSIFEFTQGISNVANCNLINIKIKIIFSSFLINFNGLCVIFQLYSYLHSTKMKLNYVILLKFLLGITSIFITIIFLHFIKF